MLTHRLPAPFILGQIPNCELYGERTTDETFGQVCQYPHLTELHLVGTAVTNAGFADIRNLTNLIWLNLEGSTQISGEGLVAIKQLRQLQGLSLEGLSGVPAVLPELLGALQSLEYLNLRNTDMDDSSLAAFPSMPNLQTLRLDDNAVSAIGVLSLKTLPSLKTLGLFRTAVNRGEEPLFAERFPECQIGLAPWPHHPLEKFLLAGFSEYNECLAAVKKV